MVLDSCPWFQSYLLPVLRDHAARLTYIKVCSFFSSSFQKGKNRIHQRQQPTSFPQLFLFFLFCSRKTLLKASTDSGAPYPSSSSSTSSPSSPSSPSSLAVPPRTLPSFQTTSLQQTWFLVPAPPRPLKTNVNKAHQLATAKRYSVLKAPKRQQNPCTRFNAPLSMSQPSFTPSSLPHPHPYPTTLILPSLTFTLNNTITIKSCSLPLILHRAAVVSE